MKKQLVMISVIVKYFYQKFNLKKKCGICYLFKLKINKQFYFF